ncbi:MAG: diguanylate cyclase [Elusimicrobia bacterium]|nr:diguanylate cyclase [Elusimicrobiota bacterium]
MIKKLDQPELLIVDDEKVIREMLEALLVREGYNVTTAENGAAGIDQIQKKFFNIAIVDIKLTDMSGMEVMKQVREAHPETVVLMVTAFATTETAIKALEAGVYDYIIKPFDINRIKMIIKRGLDEQRLTLENKELLSSLTVEKSKLESVLEIGKRMASILDLRQLIDFIVKKTTEVLKAEKGSLMLLDEATGQLIIKGAIGLSTDVINSTKMKIGDKIAGFVIKYGEAMLVENIEIDPRTKRENRPHYLGKSFISVPLVHKDKVHGVLSVAEKKDNGLEIFTEDDLNYLSIIINYAAVAIENARLYEEVRNLAITDSLTGLFNHRYFQEQLAKEINRAKRYGRPLSLVMFDIDNFKTYNDRFGHLTGDAVLRHITATIKNNAREVDIVCRYGGEEFVMILPETEALGGLAIADKVREAVAASTQQGAYFKNIGKVTISGGIAQFEKKFLKEAFIHKTDEAMYQAKKEGKNKICIWTG